MLAVLLFIALWVVLALGVFAVAIRGGVIARRAPARRGSPGARRAAATVVAVIYLGFGVVLPLLFLTGNHANASSQVAGIKLTAGEKQGRELFALRCGVCHTLAAANAVGKVGPNLDTLRPPTSLVLNTIKNGCLQNPGSSQSAQACLGQGNMPAGILQGQQARQVADFVGRVAGRE
jgi:mono/diheme cytochrome c family protein